MRDYGLDEFLCAIAQKGMTKMTNELREKLAEAMKTEKVPQAAAEYVLWQAERLGELGETTAREIIAGKLGPWKDVEMNARKRADGNVAVIDNVTVYRWIDEALHLDGVTTDAERAGFVPPSLSGAAALPGKSATLGAAATLGAGIDLDALFD